MAPARLYVLNVAGAAVFAALWLHGVARIPFEADSTGMCWGIAAVFTGALMERLAGVSWYGTWLGRQLTTLGFVGTVVGLVIALAGVDPSRAGDLSAVKAMAASLVAGMGTAFHTTLVGALGALWLAFCDRVADGR